MYYKEYRYREAVVLTNSSTLRIPLPRCGMLSAIKLDFRAQNAATLAAQLNQRICEHITFAGIIDKQGKLITGLRGDSWRAENFYCEGDLLPETATLLASRAQLTTLLIPLGRFKKDPFYALDLSKYCELELVIVNDIATAWWAQGDVNVDVQLVEICDATQVPTSFIKRLHWLREKPSGANQQLLRELPTSWPIQSITAQMWPDLDAYNKPVSDPATDSNMLLMWLSEKQNFVWAMRPKDIMRENAIEYGHIRAHGKYHHTATTWFDTTVAYVESFVDALLDTAGLGIMVINEDSNDRFQRLDAAVVTAPTDLKHLAIGVGYWHTMRLWDSLKIFGSDPLQLICGCNPYSPAFVDWHPHDEHHYFGLMVAQIVAQGEA